MRRGRSAGAAPPEVLTVHATCYMLNAMFERALAVYERALKVVVATLVAAIVTAMAGQILGRAIGHPPLWTSELLTILLVWLTFLGAALATRLAGHIRVDSFVAKLSPRNERIVRIAGLILVLAFLFIVFVAGISHIGSALGIRTPILGAPTALTAAGPAMGAIAIVPFVIDDLVKRLTGRATSGATAIDAASAAEL